MYSNILIPTDGSELADKAVQHGIALARQIGARVTALTVAPPFHVLTVDPQMIEDTHSKRGCTLDRSMRADICNTYFCGGLRAYMKGHTDPEPTVVLAGEGDKMRSSPILVPNQKL
jgi:nucleotide-binding universal stress UspA family protein